ncbi:hypothetical protein SmJEL517_g03823 [Synchytrium microbalum]|uniref:RNA helicase n=1 Tax=Synchytrium microbalum TaxID=1806994 RepID=A0A507C6Q0_9FUNG|nr:uncharacterized protein SmJEL517_g03823 [Synchytrium microbalum]TPX33223.1 hypothetical protein SmJEL517_g03823 [Synchytrium microbalum]
MAKRQTPAASEISEETAEIPVEATRKIKKQKVANIPTSTPPTTTISAAPTIAEGSGFLKKHGITVLNAKTIQDPYLTFANIEHLKPSLLKPFKSFDAPTPIQSAVWPYLFNGDDVVGVAKTGSGKTFAFGLPAAKMVRKQSPKQLGILVLVISPTRELAIQTFESFQQFGPKSYVKPVCIYGGVPKGEQRHLLGEADCNVLVATPGRLMDFMEEGVIDLGVVKMVVLDEADRMLSFGFEEDIKRILSAVPSPRQTVMFSATWPMEIRNLANTYLSPSAIRITVGSDELQANTDITQNVEVMTQDAKEGRLLQLLKGQAKTDLVLVFALYKWEVGKLEKLLVQRGYKVASIHGDKAQRDRIASLDSFKTGKTPVLVATDVAARGLDIPEVACVINFTYPLTTEEYCHRIGRTGRAGRKGIAYTFFTVNEKSHAGALVNVLKKANQIVPENLIKFGTTVKRKVNENYGAFVKDVDMSVKGKKTTFDDDDE